jgi:hypothetical protein
MARGTDPRRGWRIRVIAATAAAATLALTACASTTVSWVPAARPAPGSATQASAGPSIKAGATAAAGATFTLSAVGDTILASAPNYLPPGGGDRMFASLSDALHSDLQMANLEEPITDVTKSTKCAAASLGKTCFAYRAPTSYAAALHDAGFDLVNLANNHALDYGQAGHTQTEQALTDAGVKYTGTPGYIPVLTVKGIKVAVVGFAPYAWANNLLNIRSDQALVAKAATMADVVIVQAHMGGEGKDYQHVTPGNQVFLGENRGDAIAFSHAMIDAGADIVIGHSPHVLRGMEFYKGRLIAYSLGNFDGYHALNVSGVNGISMILRVTLRSDGSFVKANVVPITLAPPGVPSLDSKDQAIPMIQALTGDDFPSTGAAISDTGAVAPNP